MTTETRPDLLINDLFFTIQGEGFHAGRRALFIRMPYCNLACSWCDTKFDTFKRWTEDEFRTAIEEEATRFAVITGGEPMMNKQTPRIIEILKEHRYEIACESNGTYPILPGIDFATVSPKSFSKDRHQPRPPLGTGMGNYPAFFVHPHAMQLANEFKYVVEEGFPFEILERHYPLDPTKRYSLSPEFGRLKESLAEIVKFIQSHPGWRISLQTHKFCNWP